MDKGSIKAAVLKSRPVGIFVDPVRPDSQVLGESAIPVHAQDLNLLTNVVVARAASITTTTVDHRVDHNPVPPLGKDRCSRALGAAISPANS